MQNKKYKNKRKIVIFLSCFGTCLIAVAGASTILKPNFLKTVFTLNDPQQVADTSEQSSDFICDNVRPEVSSFLSDHFEFEKCDAPQFDTLTLAKSVTPKDNDHQFAPDEQAQPSSTEGVKRDSSSRSPSYQKDQVARISHAKNAASKQSVAGNTKAKLTSNKASHNSAIGVDFRSNILQSDKNQIQADTNINAPILVADNNESTANDAINQPEAGATDNAPSEAIASIEPETNAADNQAIEDAMDTQPDTHVTENESPEQLVNAEHETNSNDAQQAEDASNTQSDVDRSENELPEQIASTEYATNDEDQQTTAPSSYTQSDVVDLVDKESPEQIVSIESNSASTNEQPAVDTTNIQHAVEEADNAPNVENSDNRPVVEVASNAPQVESPTPRSETLIVQPIAISPNNAQEIEPVLVNVPIKNSENLINNGIISTSNDDLFTVTGDLSGSGLFTNDVKLLGADVNPGNSPGLLTFGADLLIDGTDTDLTHLLIEITGSDSRGVDFDAINVLGNLQFLNDLNISTSIFSPLSREDLFGVEFDILHVDGHLLDAENNIVRFDELSTLPINIEDTWAFKWFERVSGWGLVIFTNPSQGNSIVQGVSEPKTIFIASFCLILFGFRRYRNMSVLKNNRAE
jgi:hypothetical protein